MFEDKLKNVWNNLSWMDGVVQINWSRFKNKPENTCKHPLTVGQRDRKRASL